MECGAGVRAAVVPALLVVTALPCVLGGAWLHARTVGLHPGEQGL